MSSDPRKAGPIICTKQLTNFALGQRRFEQVVHIISITPAFRTDAFLKPLATFLGPGFVAALQERMDSVLQKEMGQKRPH